MAELLIHIEGAERNLALAISGALNGASQQKKAYVIELDALPYPDAIIARASAFAAGVPADAGALILIILTAPAPGLDHLAHHTANAALWAFIQQAALEWAPRHIRVNAIGLAASPTLPFAPQEAAGRAAGPAPAQAASLDDIVRTVCAIASWPSMTGQIVRLGGK